jgi:hypothetical protein
MDHTELAAHFGVAQDHVKTALIDAQWQYHEDANGRLWAVSQDSDRGC